MSTPSDLNQDLLNSIRDVPDFPKQGVVFKDITPVLQNAELFRRCIDHLADRYRPAGIDQIVAVDARGFLFAAALAYAIGAGVVLVRKKGKLPFNSIEASYDLEYGSNTIEMHVDAIQKNESVLVIDDVLATGGTMQATVDLIKQVGGKIHEIAFFIELDFLNGRSKLDGTPIYSMLRFA